MTDETPPGLLERSGTFRDALQRLGAAQKSGKGAPAYSRYVNRRLGRLLAAAAYRGGLTPNGVTVISAAFSFAGIAVLATGDMSWVRGVAVSAMLVIGYALDAADGQLARLRGGGSVTGEWLDHMVDSLKITSLHLAVLVAFYRHGEPSTSWLLIPIGYAIVAATSFFAQILNEQLTRNASRGSGRSDAPAAASLVVSVLKVPTDYGLLCLVFVLMAWPMVLFGAYTLMFAASAAYLLAASFKWFGQMQKLDRSRS